MDFPLEGRALFGAVLASILVPLSVLSACRRLGRTRYEAFLFAQLVCGVGAWLWTDTLPLVALVLLGAWACYGLGWMRRARPLEGDRRPWKVSPVGFRLYATAHGFLWVFALLSLFQGDPVTPLFLVAYVTVTEGGRNWMAWVMQGNASEPSPYRR